MSAIRRLAVEAGDNGLVPPELAAGISRVKGAKRSGVRTGNWLTVDQAEHFINAPDLSMLQGKRDRALLALMIGCGLRRAEIASLDFEHIQQREGRWAVVDLVGKHGRVRTVPMPSWAKVAIDSWAENALRLAVPVWKPTPEELRVLNEYHYALTIYYRAVSNWLNGFNLPQNGEEHRRLTDEKDKAEQTCRNLRADLDRLRAENS